MSDALKHLDLLCKKLEENEVVFERCDEDNGLIVARAVSQGSLLKEEKYLENILMVDDNANWAVITQAMVRKVEDGEGICSEKNTLKLLKAACAIYEAHYPYFDADQQYPIEWSVVFDETQVTSEGERYAVIQGACGVGIQMTTDEVYSLLESLGHLPQVEMIQGNTIPPIS